jgi:diguanylate cyclase (GGDEF)-like protein/PAS domain S-box-containing protein
LIVLVLLLMESIPLEALIWQPSTTPDVVDQALLTGFLILVLAALLAWYGTARPIETAAREQRRTLRSLFLANPEAIAVFDLDGHIVRANQAAANLTNRTLDALLGAHVESLVAPDKAASVTALFERAAGGESVSCDATITGQSDERIAVRYTFSPEVVGGRTVAVFCFARDASVTNSAEAALREQAERMADLAAVANPARATASRLHGALALLCRRLQFEEAFVAEIDGERVRLLAQETAGPRDVTTVPEDVLQRVAASNEIVEIGDFGATTVRTFAGVPLPTSGGPRIVLGLTSPYGRSHEFDLADCNFARAAASLVALALERGRQDERSGQQPFYDALTGLPNRLLVIERLSEILGSPKWRGMHFAVHYIDLEGFKEINDDFGHDVGDRILRLAARRIQDSISSLDLLARLGGDEFAVVQPLPDGDAHADKTARRVLSALAQPFVVEDSLHRLGVSIGISISSNSAPDGLSLLQHADEALYRAKHETGHRLTLAPDLEFAS